MPKGAGSVVGNEAQGVEGHPNGAVEAEGEIVHGVVLALAVVLHQNADDKAMRNMLDAVSVVAANEVFIVLDAKDAVENIFSVARRIKGDIAPLQRILCLGDIDNIAMGTEQGPHAESSRVGCEDAVFFKGILYFMGVFNAHYGLILSIIIYILAQHAFFVNKEDKFSFRLVNIRRFFSYPI